MHIYIYIYSEREIEIEIGARRRRGRRAAEAPDLRVGRQPFCRVRLFYNNMLVLTTEVKINYKHK